MFVCVHCVYQLVFFFVGRQISLYLCPEGENYWVQWEWVAGRGSTEGQHMIGVS